MTVNEPLLPPPAPEFEEVSRLNWLRHTFCDIADARVLEGSGAADYLQNGGSLRQCLREIELLAGPTEFEKRMDISRASYMSVVLTRPTLRNRLARKRVLQQTEEAYVQDVAGYVDAVINAESATEILDVHQLPSIVRNTQFENKPLLRDFAANHLYILQDVALCEHAKRREAISNYRQTHLRAQIAANRPLRLAVAGVVFAAAYAPELSFIPKPDEIITNDIELSLKALSAAIFGVDLPEVIRLKYLDRTHAKRTEELNEQLASEKESADLALRIVYSSSRYGSSRLSQNVSNRFGTDNPQVNLRRLQEVDDEIAQMHDDPGGKPYTGKQALGYAARFLIERRQQIEAVLAEETTAAERKNRFLTLTREIITEDVSRMKTGLSVVRYRKEFMKAIGVVPAMLFPDLFAGASDATTLTRDTVATLRASEDTD